MLNDNPILSLKSNDDNLNIEIDIIPSNDKVLEQQLTDLKSEINFLDNKINKLKSHADETDYLIAVSCGFLAGMIDTILVDGVFNNDLSFNKDPKEILAKDISNNISNNGLSNSVFSPIVDWNLKLLNMLSLNPDKSINGIPSNISSNLKELLSLKPFSTKDSVNDFTKLTHSLEGDNDFLRINDLNSVAAKLGRSSIPVLLNEGLVRFYYFIRELIKLIKKNKIKSIKELNKDLIKNVIPFNNRTIARMMSVSTFVMSAIDLGFAQISALNSGNYAVKFLLNINFIGVGRTIVAISTDVAMGIKLHNNRNKRIKLMNEYNSLLNKKIFYKSKDMWINAMNTESSLNSSFESLMKASDTIKDTIESNKEDLKKIGDNSKKIDVNNPGLKEEIKDIIDWE